MGPRTHAGASRRFANGAPGAALSLRHSRPTYAPFQALVRAPAPLMTVALSWRHEDKAQFGHKLLNFKVFCCCMAADEAVKPVQTINQKLT